VTQNPIDVEALLRSAFKQVELEFLKRQRCFADAQASVETADDFELLRDLGRDLLSPRPLYGLSWRDG
jgi:hypothetical protein